MTIAPFCIPAVEIKGRTKEKQALDNSRPGVGTNVMPPPIPATGTVPFFEPSDSANIVPESYNGKKVPAVPTVIATDGTQKIT